MTEEARREALGKGALVAILLGGGILFLLSAAVSAVAPLVAVLGGGVIALALLTSLGVLIGHLSAQESWSGGKKGLWIGLMLVFGGLAMRLYHARFIGGFWRALARGLRSGWRASKLSWGINFAALVAALLSAGLLFGSYSKEWDERGISLSAWTEWGLRLSENAVYELPWVLFAVSYFYIYGESHLRAYTGGDRALAVYRWGFRALLLLYAILLIALPIAFGELEARRLR